MSELTHRSASSPAGLSSDPQASSSSSSVELTSTLSIPSSSHNEESRPNSSNSLLPDRPDASAQTASSTTIGASSTAVADSSTTPSSLLTRAATVGGSRPPSISEDIQQHLLLQNQKRSHSHHSHHHSSRHHHHTSIGVDQPSSTSPEQQQQQPSSTLDPHRSLLAQGTPNDLVFLNSSLLQELQYYDVLTRELSLELEASLQHVSVLSKEVSAAHTSAEEALVQVEVLRAERRRENVVREEERKRKWKEVKELKNQIEKLKAAVWQQGMNPTNVLSLNLPNGAAATATMTNLSSAASSTGTVSTSSMPMQIPSPMNAHSRAVLLTKRDSGASVDESEVRIDMSETANTTTNGSTTLLPRKRAQLRKPKQRSSETQPSKKKKKSKKPRSTETRINENSLIRSSESEEESDDEGSTSDSDEEQKMLHDGEESDSSDEESKFGENEKDSLKLVQSIDGIIGGAVPGFNRTLSSAQKNGQPTINNVSQVLQPPLSRQSSTDSQQSIASPSNASLGTPSPFVPSLPHLHQQQLSSSLPTNLSMLPDAALSPAPSTALASPHPLLHLGLVDDPTAPVPATEYLSLYEAHALAQERITRLENRLVEQQRNWVMYLDLVQSRSRVGVRRRENSSQTGMVLNTPAEAVLADFAQEKLVFVTPSIWRAVAKSLMARDRARKEEKIRQEEAALAFTAAPSQPVQIYTSTPAASAVASSFDATTTTSTSSSSSFSSTSAVATESVVPAKPSEATVAVSTSAFHDADLVIPIDDATAPGIARTSELSVVPPKQTFYYTPASTTTSLDTTSAASSSSSTSAPSASAAATTTIAAPSSSSTSAQEEERVIIPRVQVVDSNVSADSSATNAGITAATSSSPPASRSLSPMPMPPTLQMSPPVSPRKPPTITPTTTSTAAPVSLFTRTASSNAAMTSSSLPSSLQSPTVSGRIAPSIITAQPRPGITIHGFSPAGRATTASSQASSVITPTASSFASTASSPQARSASNTTTSASINKYLDMALQSSARRKANLHAATGSGSSSTAAKQLDFGKAQGKPNEEAKTTDSNSNAPINGQTKH